MNTPPRPPLNYIACPLDEVVEDAVHWHDNNWQTCLSTKGNPPHFICSTSYRAKRITPPDGWRLCEEEEVPHGDSIMTIERGRKWENIAFPELWKQSTALQSYNLYRTLAAIAVPIEKESFTLKDADYEAVYMELSHAKQEIEQLRSQLAKSGWQRITPDMTKERPVVVGYYSINFGWYIMQSCAVDFDGRWTHYILPPPREVVEKSEREKLITEIMEYAPMLDLSQLVNHILDAARANHKLLEGDKQ